VFSGNSEFRAMDKVIQASDSERYAPSSEAFRFNEGFVN
jgi:hypothetical protein